MNFNPFSSASSSNSSSPSLASAASSSSSSASSFSMPNLLESSSASSSSASSPIILGVLIILLAFIGFNIFEYFAKGLDAVSGILRPIFAFFISLFAQIFNVSAEGVKQTASAAQAVSTAAAKKASEPKDLTTTLNTSTKKQEETNVQADDALSSIQGGGKAGWCYIGMENGYRSCASVEASDQCMSGEIFPTQDVCVNPSLRV